MRKAGPLPRGRVWGPRQEARGLGGQGTRSSPPSRCSRVLLSSPGAIYSLPQPREGTDGRVHSV